MSHQENMPNRESREDRELEELRRRWAAREQSEPPDMLDQAILNAARRAIEGRAERPRRHWLGALATAAVLVLAVTVVVRQSPRETPVPAAPAKEERQLQLQGPAGRTTEEPSAGALSSQRAMDTDAENARTHMADEASATEIPERELNSKATGTAHPLPPDEWIRRMLALEAQGDSDQLNVELKAFKRAYPDYELPAELQPRSP